MAKKADSSAAKFSNSAAKPFDVITKVLVEGRPLDWVRGLHLTGQSASIVSADLATLTTEADRVIRVEGGASPYLMHIEFQASRDKGLPLRVARYNILLREKYGVPVRSVVVLLRRQADDPGITGTLEEDQPGTVGPAETGLLLRYDVLRVWQIPVDVLLTGPLALAPLAPVAASGVDEARQALRALEERIARDARPVQADKLRGAAGILLGLRFAPRTLKNVLKGLGNMKENSFYRLALDEGRTEGIRETLLLMGQERFGTPDPATASAIEKINDPKKLEELVPRLLRVNGWAELLVPASVQ